MPMTHSFLHILSVCHRPNRSGSMHLLIAMEDLNVREWEHNSIARTNTDLGFLRSAMEWGKEPSEHSLLRSTNLAGTMSAGWLAIWNLMDTRGRLM